MQLVAVSLTQCSHLQCLQQEVAATHSQPGQTPSPAGLVYHNTTIPTQNLVEFMQRCGASNHQNRISAVGFSLGATVPRGWNRYLCRCGWFWRCCSEHTGCPCWYRGVGVEGLKHKEIDDSQLRDVVPTMQGKAYGERPKADRLVAPLGLLRATKAAVFS
jgi:hypothetical protein